MAALEFDVRLHMEQLQKDITAVNRKIDDFVQNTKKGAGEIDDQFRKVAGLVAGYFSLNFAANMVKQIALVRGEFQQLEVAFRTMLGSKAKADALMQEVVQFAAITPFELKDVASGAKSLLAFGVAADDVIPTLKSLGDVSAGLSVPIERLILNFGQVKTQAKLTGRELRDFNVAGVPIIAELAKNLGVAEKEIAAMVEVGNIGFEDVAKAFKTMTDEGGRFSNLMFEQSKTITGMISNLKDEWAMMLNEIGKSNEGAIAGALNISKSLVDNYEKVIDVLKILVATYGAYKTAVILTAVAQKAAGIAEMVKQFNNLRKGIDAARAAQTAFNTTASANPYGLALAGIALLVTAITTLVSRAKDVQRYVDEMADSVDELGKQAAIDELVRKYELLSANTEKTKEEQEELKEITKQLGSTFGNAITEVDEYGRAVELSSEKLKEQNDLLLEIKMNKAEIALAEADEKAVKLLEKQRKLIDEINSGYENNPLTGKLGEGKIWEIGEYGVKLRTQELEEVTNQLDELQDQASEAREKIADITGLNVQEQLAPYKELFQEVSKLGADEAISIKSRLLSLITASTSPEILAAITKQVEKLDSAFDPNTVGERRKQTRERLEEERELYRELSKESSRATDEQIEKQREKVEALEKSLGISKNAYKKALDEQKKLEEERLKAQQELSDRLIELENQTQASKIAIIQDGTEKTIKELDLQLRMERDAIAKAKAEMLTDLKSQGYSEKSPEYTSAVKSYKELDTNAVKQDALKRIKIENDAAKQIAELWRAVNEQFASDRDLDLADVRRYYNEKIALAREAKDEELVIALEAAQTKAEKDVDVKYGIERINMEQEVADRQLEISQGFYDSEQVLERKRIANAIKSAQQRIALYTKLGKDLYRKEIEAEVGGLEILGAEQTKIGKENLSRIISGFSEIANMVGEINEGAGDALNTFVKMADSFHGIIAGFKEGGLAGAVSIVAGLGSMMAGTIAETIGTSETMGDKLDKINRSLGIQQQILSNISGSNYWDLMAKQVSDYKKKVEKSTQAIIANINTLEFRTLNIGNNIPEDIINWDLYEILDAHNKGIITLTQTQLTYLNEGLDAMAAQADLLESSWEKLTGSTRDSIADGIIEGFLEGYDSAEDFANNFEDIMRKAMLTAIKTDIMDGPMREWYEQFAKLSEDGLTEDELKILRDTWAELIRTSKIIYDDMENATNMQLEPAATDTNENQLTGAIRGITEETAGLIAGQFYAMRENLKNVHMTGLQQLDVANNSLSHLSNIDNNTLLSYIKIEELYEETKRMHTSIKAL